MNEEAERRRKLIAEAKRARSNVVSVKTATPATLTTGGRGDEQYRLNVDYWKDKAIWKDYEIPYLFLGYEPKPCEYDDYDRIDDSLSLNDQEVELYRQYFNLIREAIKLGSLTPFEITSDSISLRATDVKEWRKTVPFIKPVKIYLEMEKEIPEPNTADISEVTKPITHNANKARSDAKKTRVELIKVFTNTIYEAMQKKGLEVNDIYDIRTHLHYSKHEFYEAFYIKNPSVKKIKLESFFQGNEIPLIVKFKPGNKPSNTNRIIDLLKS